MSDDKKKVQLLKEEDQEENSTLTELQLGEYFLHFYIQETNSLQLSDESDLLLRVKAFGEVKLSKIIKAQGPGSKTFWGTHFFFGKTFTERDDLENANFEIELLDYHQVLRNEVLGSVSGSMHSVYRQKEHYIINKWEILSNADKISADNNGFVGFLKYSVSFSQSSEPRINLEETARNDKSDTTKLTIPANIQMKKK